MRRLTVPALAMLSMMLLARPVSAGTMTYLAIGDSISFGEQTFSNNPSNGDRGYVSDYANYLASRDGGARPIVVNTAIDGETTSSLLTGSGRNVANPGAASDQAVAAWNTNYASNPTESQNVMFQQAIASAKAAGNDVGVVTISLGANDLFRLANSSSFQSATTTQQAAMLQQTLANVGSNYAIILAEVHALLPNAKVYALGEYNPFPGEPSNPLNAIAATAIQGLNATIQQIAAAKGAQYVDTYTPFVGHEADYTYIASDPGNVHPNDLGYSVIAAQIEAVPEPSTLAVMGLGLAAAAYQARRRRNRAA